MGTYLFYINDNCIGTASDFKYESYPKVIEMENTIGFIQKSVIAHVNTLECKLYPTDFMIYNFQNLIGLSLNVRIVSTSETMKYSFSGFISACEIKHGISETFIDIGFLLSTPFQMESEMLDNAEKILSNNTPLTPINTIQNKKLEIEKQLEKQKDNKYKKRTIIL